METFKIKAYNKISKVAADTLGNGYEISDSAEQPVGAIVRSAKLHDEQFPESLLAIARAGAGVNNIPIERLTDMGVAVFNTPSANANAVKELVILGLLISSRKVVPAIEWAKELKGRGDEVGALVEKGKGAFVGPEIRGKTLGVIGLGAIGVLVANAAHHLGMTVVGYDPFISLQNAWNLSHHIKRAENISEIYEKCDYISLHIPLNKDTKDTINKDVISKMRDGVRILNFARDGLVNSQDMIEALGSGKVSSYVVDFPTDEMINVPGVVCIPHLGASTPESEDNCAVMAAHELADYIENGNITNSVNLPAVSMPRSAQMRVTVIHKNISGMLSAITSAVASDNTNIENLVNKSRGEYAYTILDINKTDAKSVEKRLYELEGIIRVRII
ncbi:MAG: phosphoglycerate dehydrogenase [Clostridia bacterium]|nr:phosphoglycerate dehydrogenase [Clostridia bacterium]